MLLEARKSHHLLVVAFSLSPKAREPGVMLWESRRRWVSQPSQDRDTPFLCAPHSTSLPCRHLTAHPETVSHQLPRLPSDT